MIATLRGRRLLVVGGASGIGLAAARLAGADGAQVAVIDRQPAPEDLAGFQADLRQNAAVVAAVGAAAAKLGGVDALVFTAGIDLQSELTGMDDAAWDAVLDVNLTGAMRCCRAALPHLADGGSIVLVSSGAGLRPLPLRAAYCVSKAGLNMLAKQLAIDLAPRGIRVNALCPGAVDTPLFRSSLPDDGAQGGAAQDAVLRQVRDRYALQRIAEPEEIARTALFLASDAASYVTGVALAADGGRTFH